jgi:putative SOS response-associated peptidase YedK
VCGRFALDIELDDLISEFVANEHRIPDWAPHWNMAPTATIPIVIDRAGGDAPLRTIGPARWSLTPSWSPTLELKYPTFNARSESAAEKPTFKDAVTHHRALIPATAYYEWHTDGSVKTPYAIRPANASLFAFAGLYSVWSAGEVAVVTATMLTADATDELSWLHPRRPMALPQKMWNTWLDPRLSGTHELLNDAVASSRAHMAHVEYYRVAPLKGDGPELLAPAG